MTDKELEAVMLAARDEIDRQLDAELAADPQRDERLIALILERTATMTTAAVQTDWEADAHAMLDTSEETLARRGAEREDRHRPWGGGRLGGGWD